MTELPQGWAAALVPELVFFQEGPGLRKHQYRQAGVPFLNIRTFVDGHIQKDLCKFLDPEEVKRKYQHFLVEADDILIAISGSIGKWAVATKDDLPMVLNTSIMRFRPLDASRLDRGFLLWFLRSPEFTNQAWGSSTGSAQRNVGPSHVQGFALKVPPLAEQRRIVTKIDSLTGRSRRTRNHLDHIPRLVEKYKQALLAAAFRGDVTRDWRSLNTDHLSGPIDQSSFDLDEGERGVWPSNTLPEAWEWRRFNDVFVDLTDSGRKLPQKEYKTQGRYPVVDQGAAKVGGYTDRAELVHQAAPPFIIFGDHTRCVKYIEQRFVQGADGVKVLHVAADTLPSYACLALTAVELPDKGYSRHMKFVRSTLFPIAPLAEQAEVVRRVANAFAWIDRLASEATSARTLVDRLDQAVLAKAFRGELVPQDPTDEPASVLLERIRAEHEAAPKARRGRRAAAE